MLRGRLSWEVMDLGFDVLDQAVALSLVRWMLLWERLAQSPSARARTACLSACLQMFPSQPLTLFCALRALTPPRRQSVQHLELAQAVTALLQILLHLLTTLRL